MCSALSPALAQTPPMLGTYNFKATRIQVCSVGTQQKQVGDQWSVHPLNSAISMLNSQTSGRPPSTSAKPTSLRKEMCTATGSSPRRSSCGGKPSIHWAVGTRMVRFWPLHLPALGASVQTDWDHHVSVTTSQPLICRNHLHYTFHKDVGGIKWWYEH